MALAIWINESICDGVSDMAIVLVSPIRDVAFECADKGF